VNLKVGFITPCRNAIKGLFKIASGRMFRIALGLAIVLNIWSWFYITTLFDKLIILTFTFIILCFEGFNSTLEGLLDVISPKYSKEVGVVKDMLAGTVIIAVIGAAIIGAFIIMRILGGQ
jgi:diacylglycerol kinase (ATP)